MKKRLLAIIATAAMVVTMIPSMAFAAPADTDVAAIGETGYATLQEAIDAASATSGNHEIKVLKDVSSDVSITQKEGINITLDGNNKVYSGTITINGQSRYQGAETIVIKNFKFETTEASHDFIWSHNGNNGVVRYAHNVTVQDCDFVATGSAVNSAVGLRFSQAYDIAVKNCTATGLHSLMWVDGMTGVDIIDVEIENCKNGISLGNSLDVNVKNTVIEATGPAGYGLRADADAPGSITIENCDVDAYIPVAVRKAKANATNSNECQLNISTDTELTARNNEGIEVAITDKEDEEPEVVAGTNVAVKEVAPAPAPTPSTPAEKPDNSPNTGDNSMAPIAVAGLALAAMAAVVATRRRTN